MKKWLGIATILLAGSAWAEIKLNSNLAPPGPFFYHFNEEHFHGIEVPAITEWARLGDAACTPATKPATRAVVIEVSEFETISVPATPRSDSEYMKSALRARGVTAIRNLVDSEATFAAIVSALTKVLSDSSCGDRIILTWSGRSTFAIDRVFGPYATGRRLAREQKLMIAYDAKMGKEGCGVGIQSCNGFLTSHDLVDFVVAARNRGVEVALLFDTTAGIEIGRAQRRAVWEFPQTSADISLQVRDDAADFFAIFGVEADGWGRNDVTSPDGSRVGAFTLAVTTALQDPEVQTPRSLGPRVASTLSKLTMGEQVPIMHSSNPDMRLFQSEHGSEAELAISAPIANRGITVARKSEIVVAGQFTNYSRLIGIFVDGKPVDMNANGSFRTTVNLNKGENIVQVSGLYDDRSFTSRAIKVVRSEDASSQLQQGQLYALVIGVEEYDDPNIRDLKTPLADLRAVTQILTEQYRFKTSLPGDSRQDTLVLRNASRREIVSALERLVRSVAEQDRVLIYFAGHSAIPEGLQQAYWLPSDALYGDSTDWIESDRVRATIRRMRAKSVLVVSDSCYSAALTSRDLGESNFTNDASRDSFLLKMVSQRSRILIASGNFEPVSDGGGSGHSIFARALIEQLRQPGRRDFTSSELFAPIVEKVAGNSRQSPQRSIFRDSGHDGGDFVFFRTSE